MRAIIKVEDYEIRWNLLQGVIIGFKLRAPVADEFEFEGLTDRLRELDKPIIE